MYSFTDLSIESITLQLHLEDKEVLKIIDDLSQVDEIKSVIDQDATLMENIMTRDVASLDASLATVLDAASVMSEREIGSVVVTKQGLPFGIVTERDSVRRARAKDEYTLEMLYCKILHHTL